MKKKNQTLADKILNYIRRNDKEQIVPVGYKSIMDWCKELGCTRRMWGIILYELLKTKRAKKIRLRRVVEGKIRVLNYYQIDDTLIRDIKK